MAPLVSIIVPVFKVEEYLPFCIESIQAQTYSNWELILIDDGSPDRSGLICDEYANYESRIRVFHKGNSGVSSSRNLGIENARGEWILFLDSDDTILPNTLEICSQYFNHCDVIRFSMRNILSKDGTKVRDVILDDMSRNVYLSKIVSRETILGVCAGMYRTSLFIENNIRFNTQIIQGEDWLVLTELLYDSTNCIIIKDPLYVYNRTNNQSCTNTFKFENADSVFTVYQLIKQMLHADTSIRKSCFSKAKCKLVYEFAVCKLKKQLVVSKQNRLYYRGKAQLSFYDIVSGCTSIKMFALLLLYISIFGRVIL